MFAVGCDSLNHSTNSSRFLAVFEGLVFFVKSGGLGDQSSVKLEMSSSRSFRSSFGMFNKADIVKPADASMGLATLGAEVTSQGGRCRCEIRCSCPTFAS